MKQWPPRPQSLSQIDLSVPFEQCVLSSRNRLQFSIPILTVPQELEFLTDTSIISPEQLSSILAQLPAQTPLHAPLQAPANAASTTPVEQFSNLNLNLKEHYAPVPTPAPLPPPAYVHTPQVLSVATALYAYSPTDAGDLALQQGDRIQVIEHMNNDCTCPSLDELIFY